MYKRLLLIFSLILGSIGIATFFVWQQAMQLPSWYTQSSSKKNVTFVNQGTKKLPQTEELLRKISDNLTDKTIGEVELDEEEVNSLILSSISKKDNTSKFARAIKGTNTRIQNGKISVGAVIETSSIPLQELSARKQTKMIQLLQSLPVKEKNIYIGIEGKPSIRNQQLSFDDTTRISLGNFSFPMAEASQNLGISQESLNQLIAQELKKLPIKLDNINIQDEHVIIRGSQNNL
ncbi:MAG: hypothetical protein AAF915_05370 [Cyanobacteria bacterium P01_D01_bin.50]